MWFAVNWPTGILLLLPSRSVGRTFDTMRALFTEVRVANYKTVYSDANKTPEVWFGQWFFLVSRSVPNAKSHLVAHIQTPSPSPRRHLSEVPQPDQSHKSVPIISNWTQWAPSHRTPSHHQNFSWCGCP